MFISIFPISGYRIPKFGVHRIDYQGYDFNEKRGKEQAFK